VTGTNKLSVGMQFGRLTIIAKAHDYIEQKSGRHREQWLCQCECGNQKVIIGNSLTKNKHPTRSCGCLRSEIEDLSGLAFGRLTVLSRAKNKENGRTAWNCLCDCGNSCIVGTKELKNGETQSCGCLRDDLLTKNLLGQKFGKLTVIRRADNHVNYDGAFWECECECGNKIITSGKRLMYEHTTSCGCLKSKGEQKIASLLSHHKILYTPQYTFPDCVTENGFPCRFDFGILDEYHRLRCLIEYDGIQHFEESNFDLQKNKMRDAIKNDYCKQHNIPLIRIPYTDFDKLNITYIKERINEYV
jgi:hypothetical protein